MAPGDPADIPDTSSPQGAPERGRVRRLAATLAPLLSPSNIVNTRYADQNFYYQRELARKRQHEKKNDQS